MFDPLPSRTSLDAEAAVDALRRGAGPTYLTLMAGLGGALTGVILMMSMAANSGQEAERLAEAQRDGYGATLVAALTVNFSKPLR